MNDVTSAYAVLAYGGRTHILILLTEDFWWHLANAGGLCGETVIVQYLSEKRHENI